MDILDRLNIIQEAFHPDFFKRNLKKSIVLRDAIMLLDWIESRQTFYLVSNC